MHVCVVYPERDNDRQTAGRESADGLGPHTRPPLPSFRHSESIFFFFFFLDVAAAIDKSAVVAVP